MFSPDSFEKANHKLYDAFQYNLSEVNTETEDFQKSQRKKRAKKIYSSSDEEELNETCMNNIFPTPPKKKLQKNTSMINGII